MKYSAGAENREYCGFLSPAEYILGKVIRLLFTEQKS